MLEKEDLEIKRNNNEKSCEKENSTEKPRKLAKNKTKKNQFVEKLFLTDFLFAKKVFLDVERSLFFICWLVVYILNN